MEFFSYKGTPIQSLKSLVKILADITIVDMLMTKVSDLSTWFLTVFP